VPSFSRGCGPIILRFFFSSGRKSWFWFLVLVPRRGRDVFFFSRVGSRANLFPLSKGGSLRVSFSSAAWRVPSLSRRFWGSFRVCALGSGCGSFFLSFLFESFGVFFSFSFGVLGGLGSGGFSDKDSRNSPSPFFSRVMVTQSSPQFLLPPFFLCCYGIEGFPPEIPVD